MTLALTSASVEWSLVRPAIIDDKAVLPCSEDYSPCYCGDYPTFGLYIVCELVTIEAIVSVFNRTTDNDIFWLQLRPLPDLENRGVTLPADLLSGKRARAIDLYCPSVVTGNLYSLTIDPYALTSSENLIEYFYILGCDLSQQPDFNFLNGFNKLMNLYMYGSTNIQAFQNLPALPNLGTLSINQCTGLDSIEFPAQSLPKLQQVYLTDNHLDDLTAKQILTAMASSSSVDTVIVLSLAYNLLTQIPAQILSFVKLNDLSLSGNEIAFASSASLAFPASRMERLAMVNVSLNVIEPGALRGISFRARVILTYLIIIFNLDFISYNSKYCPGRSDEKQSDAIRIGRLSNHAPGNDNIEWQSFNRFKCVLVCVI
jgi:hypothetical protein